jgi:hypothetical protein
MLSNGDVSADDSGLHLAWENNILTISGPKVPGERVEIWYLEAYCRPGSTDREWSETTIGHRTELLEADKEKRSLRLRCTLRDGVTVDHEIRAAEDEVNFQLVAHNPTTTASQVSWVQPCIRVNRFTGRTQETYLDKCFIFLDGKLRRMPFEPWATKARYIPGQVWRSPDAHPDNVNPRPVSKLVPDDGLIGCFSADETMMLATAWEPYQELFQGVGVCIHSDFRIGGLSPGETKRVRGKIYIVAAEAKALLDRYHRDFPEAKRRRGGDANKDSAKGR